MSVKLVGRQTSRRGRGKKNEQTNVWKIKKIAQRLLAQLHPSSTQCFNVAIQKLCKIDQFSKKLFAIGIPYKHFNF